jgi:integrase
MPHTSGGPSARSWRRPGWILTSGLRASCGTAVSLLSDADVPIAHISRLVGHSSTTTTETIYRKQIRPVIVHGADIMDRIFPAGRTPDA